MIFQISILFLTNLKDRVKESYEFFFCANALIKKISTSECALVTLIFRNKRADSNIDDTISSPRLKAHSELSSARRFRGLIIRVLICPRRAIYLLMSAKRVPQGTLLGARGTAGCSFRITIKHDLSPRDCAFQRALVIPSARNGIPRKREKTSSSQTRGGGGERSRRSRQRGQRSARGFSDVLIMRSNRDLLRITLERLTWTGSQLLTAIHKCCDRVAATTTTPVDELRPRIHSLL